MAGVCEHELEGVVAKPKRSRYAPGERGWIKIKNRAYWRWDMEREGASKIRRQRQFASAAPRTWVVAGQALR